MKKEKINKFVFDVDGTLTPSRGKIDENFSKFFFDFCTLNKVYLVTGSDRAKTIEQVGNVIYGMCKRVYNCSGNDVYEGSTNIRTTDWTLPALARTFLINCEYESPFTIRTGNHIEERPGLVNFSIVGRNANLEERARYVAYDTFENERKTIATAFNTMFPDLQATVGGETGIDIAPKGADKSQIITDFDKNDHIYFFGDAMFEGGNDYSLSKLVSHAKPVISWKQTWEYLTWFQEQRIAN
jgi:phosphomannomutase